MKVFNVMESMACEQVVFCYDKNTGLKSIIAFHDTTLGASLGGCRMYNYANEEEALTDAVRLARGMTMKSSIAGLDFGGGKAVIWGDPANKSEPLLRAMGRFVEGLKGRLITGTDMGTESTDFVIMNKETRYLTSLPKEMGGSGDSSWITAYGVFHGMRACMEEVFGNDSFENRTIALQGIGKVGRNLGKMLYDKGAKIFAAEISEQNVKIAKQEFDFTLVQPEEIYELEVDMFSPNATGGIINDISIPKLNCKIIAGGANNQLAEEKHGKILYNKGILYAPDFVINAGGLILVAADVMKENQDIVNHKVEQIYFTLKKIFTLSKERSLPTHDVAELLAMERIDLLSKIKNIYVTI